MNRRGRVWASSALALAVAALEAACNTEPSSSGKGATAAASSGGSAAASAAPLSAASASASARDAAPPSPAGSAALDASPEASAPQLPLARCAEGCASPAAAYAKLLPGTRGHPCNKPSTTFPDLMAVGRYNEQLGCVPQGVIADCCLRTPNDLAPQKLSGWPTVAKGEREKQALAWAREIVFAFANVLDTAPSEFTDRHHAFAPPTVISLPSGGVSVTMWIRERPGLTKGQVFTAQQVRFSPRGTIEGISQISQWVK